MTMIFKFDGIMKKYLFSAIAISAMAFTACTEQPIDPVEPNQETVTINFISGNELDATKTYIDADNNVFWNASGEYLKIFETIDSQTKAVESKAGVVSEDGTTASFSAEFTTNTEGSSYSYHAIYPNTAYVNETDLTKIKVLTPAIQNPTLTSFDPAADLLISKTITKDAQPGADETLSLNFARIVAVGKIAIYGLPTTDPVTSVVFTAPEGVNLNGRTSVNMTEGKIVEYGYFGASNIVTMNYTNAPDFTKAKESAESAIFTCLPCEIVAGSKFTVTVTTATKKYTKECTIPESGKALSFEVGKSTKFTVDMSTSTETDLVVKDFSGTYVIAAASSTNVYAITGTLTGSDSKTRLTSLSLNVTVIPTFLSDVDNNMVWAIEKFGEGYSVKNAASNLYICYQDNGNYAQLTESQTALHISLNADELTYTIGYAGNVERILAKNTSAEYFAFYKGSGLKELYLIPTGEDTRTPLATPSNVKAELVSEKLNSIKLDWDANTAAASYVVTYRYDTTSETKTVTTNTLTLDGLMYGKDYYFSVVAVPADAKANKESAASDEVKCTTGAAPTLTGEGTLESPYTPADVLTFVEATTSAVYVSGKISEIIEVTVGNAARYYISTDGTSTQQVQVYMGLYLNGDTFTSTDQIKVGDEVIVYGKISLYQNVPQIARESRIYSLNGVTGSTPEEPEKNTEDLIITGLKYTDGTELHSNPIVSGNVTITSNESSDGVKYYNAGLRWYANKTLKLSSTQPMSKIVMTILTSSNYGVTTDQLSVTTGTITANDATITWEGSASEVTITNKKSNQIRVTAISVTY